MNSKTLKKASGPICLVCVLTIVVSAAKVIPLGMGGDLGDAKTYIVLVILAFIIAVPSAFIYQTTRSGSGTDPELDKMRIERDTLSNIEHETHSVGHPNNKLQDYKAVDPDKRPR